METMELIVFCVPTKTPTCSKSVEILFATIELIVVCEAVNMPVCSRSEEIFVATNEPVC